MPYKWTNSYIKIQLKLEFVRTCTATDSVWILFVGIIYQYMLYMLCVIMYTEQYVSDSKHCTYSEHSTCFRTQRNRNTDTSTVWIFFQSIDQSVEPALNLIRERAHDNFFASHRRNRITTAAALLRYCIVRVLEKPQRRLIQ